MANACSIARDRHNGRAVARWHRCVTKRVTYQKRIEEKTGRVWQRALEVQSFYEWKTKAMPRLDRPFDLSKQEDRDAFLAAASDDSALSSGVFEHLLDYCIYFPGVDWQRMHSGIVNVPAGEKLTIGYDIRELLELVAAIKRLKHFGGFETLLVGLNNPTQVASTIFEIRVADWCRGRRVSTGITFSPEVLVKGHRKRPEFLWRTIFGDCFCECKRSNFLQNSFQTRLITMTHLLDGFFKRYPDWDPTLRLDVTFGRGTTNYLRRDFQVVIDQAQRALSGNIQLGCEIRANEVMACFRRRNEVPPIAPDTMRLHLATIGTVSTELTAASYLSLTMDVSSYRAEATVRLIRDAKSQLPRDKKSLIVIEGVGYVAAKEKLKTLLTIPAYERIPWVSLWMHGQIRAAVWRNEEHFDSSLLEPA